MRAQSARLDRRIRVQILRWGKRWLNISKFERAENRLDGFYLRAVLRNGGLRTGVTLIAMNNDLPPTPLDRSLDMSLREWIEYYQASVVTKQVHHRGVPTWKNVFDLCVPQEIIHETQPENRD
jgi:hypothetical protein